MRPLPSKPRLGPGDTLAVEVPPSVHDDVHRPIPVVVTLRWATGIEEQNALAVEWRSSGPCAVVRVRLRGDRRVTTGCVRLPAGDVRRR